MSSPDESGLRFTYRFKFADGSLKMFEVRLGAESLNLVSGRGETPPDWARLEYHQCPNCPLKPETSPYCPVAVNLSEIVRYFSDVVSFDPVDVEIETELRTFVKRTELYAGLSSLIGIYMVTSGCPILGRLKPMVQTHLPFATWQETYYRAVSMYLTAQYFVYKSGGTPDWDLKHLIDVYEQIRTVNKAFCERIRDTQLKDTTLNAIIELDCFAGLASSMLQMTNMEPIRRLFSSYLAFPDLKPEN